MEQFAGVFEGKVTGESISVCWGNYYFSKIVVMDEV
jgi:hypothetical protein